MTVMFEKSSALARERASFSERCANDYVKQEVKKDAPFRENQMLMRLRSFGDAVELKVT